MNSLYFELFTGKKCFINSSWSFMGGGGAMKKYLKQKKKKKS